MRRSVSNDCNCRHCVGWYRERERERLMCNCGKYSWQSTSIKVVDNDTYLPREYQQHPSLSLPSSIYNDEIKNKKKRISRNKYR